MRLHLVVAGLVLSAGAASSGCAGIRSPGADATPPAADARSEPPPDASADAAAGVDPRRFTPYFSGEVGGVAARALHEEDWATARTALVELAASLPNDSVVAVRARFAAAVCAYEMGEHAISLRELPPLAAELPLLADHAYSMSAVSAYRQGDFESAAALAAQVSERSPLRADAELLRGDALRALERWEHVEQVFRSYLSGRRDAGRQAEAAFKLAEAIERRLADPPDLDRVREAIQLYRRVMYQYPRSRWAREARPRVDALARHLPAPEVGPAKGFTAEEQLARGEAYARVHRHAEAIRQLTKVLSLTEPDGPIGCKARLAIGRAAYNARQREKAAEVLTQAASVCEDPDVRAWSLYLAGRSLTARDDERAAVQVYATLEREHSKHRLADDARLRRARALFTLGEDEQATELLQTMPAAYPNGDMLCEGQWVLAWRAWTAGELERALSVLRAAEPMCSEPEEGAGGRERYWVARALERLGRADEAKAAYREVVRRHPLSYYMLLAIGRLEAMDAAVAGRLLDELAPADVAVDEGWRFDPRRLAQERELLRGIELWRLGLGELARIELGAADSHLAADDELRWLSALLHHQVGSYPVSHTIARRDLTGWRASYPDRAHRRFWEIGFPRGYAELVRREAGAAGVEPELVWAVMREESGFTPTIESYANAVGLMQLLPSTAARFAQGRRADRAGLRVPENNVPIGARYLAWLLQRQQGSPILAVASYNAGEGAVDRWRRRDPDLELDEALEAFTYDQTRRYTRRVLASYGTYHFLYNHGRVPRLLGTGAMVPPSQPAPNAGSSEDASPATDGSARAPDQDADVNAARAP